MCCVDLKVPSLTSVLTVHLNGRFIGAWRALLAITVELGRKHLTYDDMTLLAHKQS